MTIIYQVENKESFKKLEEMIDVLGKHYSIECNGKLIAELNPLKDNHALITPMNSSSKIEKIIAFENKNSKASLITSSPEHLGLRIGDYAYVIKYRSED